MFASNETRDATTNAPFISVAGVGLQIKLFGQEFAGDLAFTKDTDGVSVVASNVELSFSDQGSNVSARGPPFFQLTNGHGTLSITSAGVVADLAATVALDLPGVSLGGDFHLLVDTTSAATPGPFFRISGENVTLDILGQKLTADVSVEQTTVAGQTTTQIEIADASLSLCIGGTGDECTGGTTYFELEDGAGSFTISSAGVVGRLSAHVSTNNVPSFNLTGGIALAVDTTTAGGYFRFEATGDHARAQRPRLADRQLRLREDHEREPARQSCGSERATSRSRWARAPRRSSR